MATVPSPHAAAVESDPAPGTGQECPADVQGAVEPIADGEAEALALAVACEVAVEVTSARGFSERVWAQPDGALLAEISAVPRFARDDAGAWVDIDPTLVLHEGGAIRSTATVSDVEISSGGDGPFVTVTDPDGGALALTWPDPLPSPTLAGDTATYPDVLPGVDLTVTADLDGFSYALVVHSAEAAAHPSLARVEVGIAATDLELSQDPDGLVVAADTGGEPVFSSGPALMWDSSTPSLSGDGSPPPGLSADDLAPGRMAQMPIELEQGTLAVLPDLEMLTDAATTFPVFIDPPFTGSRTHWANVHREQPSRGWTGDSNWPRAGGMRVGMCDWPGCDTAQGLWRSVVRFDTKALSGRHIVSAAVRMTQTHTGGCGGPYPLQLWQVSAFTNGVSWNGVNWMHGSALQTRDVGSSNSSCGHPNRAVTFNNSSVRTRVQAAANAGNQTISFGVRSGTTNRDQWRRISRDSLRLEVEYASLPQTPTGLSTHGLGCATSAPGPWLTTGRPSLSGTPRNADGNGRYHLRVRREGSTSNFYEFRSGTVTVNRTVTHTVTSAGTLPDGAYRWQMRTESTVSGVTPSSYASMCHFRVDTTPPPEPKAERLTHEPQLGQPVEFRLIGSADTHRFRYNLSGGSNTTVTASGGAATITVNPPTTSIDHQLQVWALDEAGNLSDRHNAWFTTGKVLLPPAAGVWRFDGDWRDDSGNGHHLVPGSGASLTSDRGARSEAVLRTPASNGCVKSDGPVLDTSQSYTVAAWVKLVADSATSVPAIVTQSGQNRSAFYLEWRRNTGAFNLRTPSADVSDVSWFNARGASPVTTGQWYHVAGVYDAPAQQLRLYVDGALDGTGNAHPRAWQADGPLIVGCSGRVDGSVFNASDYEIDDVVAYPGVLTEARIQQVMEGRIPAGEVSRWPLRGNGEDIGPAGNNLTIPASAQWDTDRMGRFGSALRLDGNSCAVAGLPAVRTDDSFAVAAWADPAVGGEMTVVALSGQNVPAAVLRRNGDGRWEFVLRAADGAGADQHRAVSQEVATGDWQHLTGVYHADAGTLRLFVDRELQGEVAVPPMWRATGPFHVGCEHSAVGTQRFNGAIDDIRVWRGVTTPDQVLAAAVEQVSFWPLTDFVAGTDIWSGNTLSFHGEHDWVDDRFGFPGFALGLDGNGWAQTEGPVVATDESFTVSAWARLDNKSDHRTVVAQAAGVRPSFYLKYHPGTDRWRFEMPAVDEPTTAWHQAHGDTPPTVGVWYHLAGVFDAGRGEVRLYVNGVLQDTVAGPANPWHVDGELLIGTAGDIAGERWSPMVGAISFVRIYAGVLDDLELREQSLTGLPLPSGEHQAV